MAAWLPTLCALLAVGAPPVDARFAQVAPAAHSAGAVLRSPGQARAVVLIHGLHLHPFKHPYAARADFRPWQLPGSVMVRTLSADADVFAFAYAQTVPVEEIPALPELVGGVRRLRQLGYTEVVLVGFSAGGLVARQLVEDNPDLGVSRVVQVCTPNTGSSLAHVKIVAGSLQEPFLRSLTGQWRTRSQLARQERRVPDAVQFVCVVGAGLGLGDGIVSTRSQWPEDLQRQGIPAVVLGTEHLKVMRGEREAQVITHTACSEQPRWDVRQVSAMRQRLWGRKAGGI
jgi:pimeloyl-ACP methyl ester carboxylesterase